MTAKVGMDFMQGNAASIGCILVKFAVLCAENAGKNRRVACERESRYTRRFRRFLLARYRRRLCHERSSGVIKFIEENC